MKKRGWIADPPAVIFVIVDRNGRTGFEPPAENVTTANKMRLCWDSDFPIDSPHTAHRYVLSTPPKKTTKRSKK